MRRTRSGCCARATTGHAAASNVWDVPATRFLRWQRNDRSDAGVFKVRAVDAT
jgi:hypothetical protein